MQFGSLSRRALRRYVVGDVVAIIVFVAIGEIQHGNPVTRVAFTAPPFLVAWAVAAYAAGAYASGTDSSIRASLGSVLLAWGVADVLAQAIRLLAGATGLLSGVESAPAEVFLFAVVTYLFGALFLGVWRLGSWAVRGI